MKKISAFIVDRRNKILVIMLILAAVCGALMLKVNINSDMTKYLADSSNMKQGIDVMAEEFSDLSTTNQIRLMFTDLPNDEKQQVKEWLSGLDYVDSVGYEPESEDYNKDNYTLYEINTYYDFDSDEETSIRDAIAEKYDGYDYLVEQSGAYSSGLTIGLIATALTILLIVLFSMSGSWIEPFIFLAVIGVAVLMNMGTNAFKSSVSETTYSIAAILQLVLSMDYSIILMNRYKQERDAGQEKTDAMKSALVNAFSSVTSSAVTTFVGLMMLVFMSFKIGADLGIVLAKGVFFSLICVFLVLPALIVMCDSLIKKTKKKVLNIHTGGLARFSSRFRVPLTAAFIIIFIGAYFLQSKTAISFSMDLNGGIGDIFPAQTTTAILYSTEDENSVQAIVDGIADDENIVSAVSYPTLLSKEETADELSSTIGSLGSLAGGMDTGIKLEPYMLKLIYYKYWSDEKLPDVKAADLIKFISENVAENEMFSAYISDDIKSSLGTMKLFADKENLTREMTASGLADAFGMDEDELKQMFVLYYADRQAPGISEITVKEFVDFLKNDILTDDSYSSMIDEDMASQIDTLAALADRETILTPMTSSEMAELLGTDESELELAFTLKNGIASADDPVSVYDMIDYMLSSKLMSSQMDDETISQLTTMKSLMDAVISGESLSYAVLSDITGMDSSYAKQLLLLYTAKYGDTSQWGMSVQSFINFVSDDILSNPDYSSMIDDSYRDYLTMAKGITDAVVNDRSLSSDDIISLFGGAGDMMNESTVNLLLTYYGSVNNYNDSWKMSIVGLFDYLCDDLVNDPDFSAVLGDDMKSQLGSMKEMMAAAVSSLRRENHSLLSITTKYPDESDETMAFMAKLNSLCDANLKNDHYIIGSSAMYYEMSQTFRHEMLVMTLLTAISIFLIVLISFRNALIPTILVLLVQCAVFITVAVSYIRGYAINYLAYLIVQCILMGSTIDYGILFTNYYREHRRTMDVKQALVESYKKSINTILTSGLIMIGVTGVIGVTSTNPTIGPICQTISLGTLSAVLLILFVLPGMLAASDRLIIKKDRHKKK